MRPARVTSSVPRVSSRLARSRSDHQMATDGAAPVCDAPAPRSRNPPVALGSESRDLGAAELDAGHRTFLSENAGVYIVCGPAVERRLRHALPRPPLREGDRHAEPDGRLRSHRGVASIRHPLAADEQVDRRPPFADDHPTKPEAERQGDRGALAPVERPARISRLDVQPARDVAEQDRLDRQDADARTVGGRVGERDGVLDQAAEQPFRQTLVDRAEGRADLPGTLASDAVGGGRKD